MERQPFSSVSLLRDLSLQAQWGWRRQNSNTRNRCGGVSSSGRRWYARRLGEFQRFLDGRLVGQDVAVLGLPDGQDNIHSRLSRKVVYGHHPNRSPMPRGLALTTINGSARAIRAFAIWLAEERYTQDNVFKPIRPLTPPKEVIQPLSPDEVRQLLGAIRQHTLEGARNYAVFLLFLDCEWRISELVNLKLADVDFAGGEIKDLGKANKERTVPVALVTRKALIRYRDPCPLPAARQLVWLFLTHTNELEPVEVTLRDRMLRHPTVAKARVLVQDFQRRVRGRRPRSWTVGFNACDPKVVIFPIWKGKQPSSPTP